MSRYGYMDDDMTDFLPGVNCLNCGRFVGRDGYIGIGYFERSNDIAYVEGECARCIAHERLVARTRAEVDA